MKRLLLKMDGKEMLTKEQMKGLWGGISNPLKANAEFEEAQNCYMCCTPDFSLCGQCDTSGNGQCQGQGVPVTFCCVNQGN